MLAVVNAGMGPEVHKAGCRDIERTYGKRYAQKYVDTFEDLDSVMETFLDTGDPDNPGWHEEEIKLFPCVNRAS
jgi:hypothetical protein